jgi:chromosome segregation ATPase
MSNIEKEIRNKDNLIFELSNEIENLRTLLSNKEANSEKTSILGLEIETYKDKTLKLKELLDNTIAHYEKGIESIKNKQKQKLSEMKIQNENLSKEYENLKQILARYEEKIDEINNEKEIMREMNKSLDNEKNDNLESIKS